MGGHASLTVVLFHTCVIQGDRDYGCFGGRDFHGLTASLGFSSHEPLQWTLQGVLGAEIQTGLYLPWKKIRVPACVHASLQVSVKFMSVCGLSYHFWALCVLFLGC